MAKLVERIRTALGRRDGVPEETIRELAVEYSQQVSAVNERLSQAAGLLDRGLRSEALQVITMAPDALDLATQLDFPEFEEWCEVLQFYTIPVPDGLQRELAERVNQAFTESLPLEATMRQHRRLAIARAPLAWRLRTLRRIAELDPMNPVWQDDIKVWEKARLEELKDEVGQAVASKDAISIARLEQELTQQPWQYQPDPELVAQLTQARQDGEQQQYLEQAESLAPQLHESFGQFDEPATRKLLKQWQAVASKCHQQLPESLLEQVEPAKEWIRQMDVEAAERNAQKAAIAKLQSRLDQNRDRVAIEAAYHACQQFDEPIPQPLSNRYHLAIEQWNLRARRRNQALLVGVVLFAVTIASLLVYWQQTAAFENKVVRAQQRLQPLVDSGDLQEAENFWDRLQEVSPKVCDDSRLVALHGRLQALQDEESQRAQQFQEYLAAADVETPEQMDPGALNKAEDLAANEDEKVAAFQVRSQYERWNQDMDTRQTEGLLADLEEIRQELDGIEAMAAIDVPVERFPRLTSVLGTLERRYPRASPASKAQIPILRTRTSTMRDAVFERRMQIEEEAIALRRAGEARSLSALQQVLSSFARTAPDSPLGKAFAKAAAAQPHQERLVEWNQLVVKTRSAFLAGFESVKPAELETRFTTLAAAFAANPAADSIEKTSWRETLRRYDSRIELLEEILAGLADTVYGKLYTVIHTESGERAFVHKQNYDRRKDQFRIILEEDMQDFPLELVINKAGAVRTERFPTPFNWKREPYDTVQWLKSVSQSAGAKIAADWEREMIRVIVACNKRKELDGIIKEMFLLHLLAGACRGSRLLETELLEEIEAFQERSSEREDWFDKGPQGYRLDLDREASLMTELERIYHSIPSREEELDGIATQQYQWVGCLLSDDGQKLVPAFRAGLQPTGKLAVALPSRSNSDQTEVVLVGESEEGKVRLQTRDLRIVAGTPLFLLPQKP